MRWRDRAVRFLAPPPYTDELGRKGIFERLTRYQPHRVRMLTASEVPPRLSAPINCVFLSDFHVGSHAGDVARFEAIADEVAAIEPDLVLFGGDYMNMMMFGGGRVPPQTIARILGRISGRIGRFAILGNHDFEYGSEDVTRALEAEGIVVLNDASHRLAVGDAAIDIVGIPDCRVLRPAAVALLERLDPDIPALVLAHDPIWFSHLPRGPHLMLAGHTHGGQIRLPGIGAIVNSSHAPLRWSYGLVEEGGRRMYVTSGLGTSTLPIRAGIPPEYVCFTF
jgi:predicted MPP superfamily phosphohydrolase